jgi:predicted RNA-binding Zn-ribbon protein involved in translation (DUF1610 family)
MSIKVPHCQKCNRESDCEQVGAYSRDREDMFAVAWKCPQCGDKTLIVSPIGPLVLKANMCLNCGHEGHSGDSPCPSCGAVLSEVLGAQEQTQSDEVLLEFARIGFQRGACRRGLTIVNFVLQRNPRSKEAWSIKGQFLEYLGFKQALKTVMQEAVRQASKGETRPDQRLGKRWWEFWK